MMSILWQIKLIGCMAIMAAPFMALFSCPCVAVYAEQDYLGEHSTCCSCAVKTTKQSCCNHDDKQIDDTCENGAKYNCDGKFCKCAFRSVYGELRALAPSHQRMLLTQADWTLDYVADVVGFQVSELIRPENMYAQTNKTALHLMKCVLLC